MSYIYWMIIIEVVLMIVIYVHNKGDVFAPSFLALLLFFIATLCIFYNEELWAVTYTKEAFSIVVLGFVSIYFADLLSRHISKYKIKIMKRDSKRITTLPDYLEIRTNVLVIIYIVMFLGLVEQIIELFRMGNTLGIGIAINLIGVVKESDLNFTPMGRLFYQVNNILMSINLFVLAYNCGSNKKGRKLYLNAIPSLVGFFNLIITGSRSILYRAVFMFIITYVMSFRQHRNVSINKTSKVLIKKISVPMVVITLLFYGLRAITKLSTASKSRAFIEYITYYIGSPLYIFHKYIINPASITNGSKYFGGLTFSGFYNSLFKFGIIDTPIPNLKHIYVGNPSNGYYAGGNEFSLFMRPYDDFGIVGMIIFVFVLFFIFSVIYYNLRRNNGLKKYLETLLIYSYFFYIAPLAFYYPFTVQESKIMNIIYILIMVYGFKIFVLRRWNRDDKNEKRCEY